MNNRKTKLLLLICFLSVITLQAMDSKRPIETTEDTTNQPAKKKQRVIESLIDHSLNDMQPASDSTLDSFLLDFADLNPDVLLNLPDPCCHVEPFSTKTPVSSRNPLADASDAEWHKPLLGGLDDDFTEPSPANSSSSAVLELSASHYHDHATRSIPTGTDTDWSKTVLGWDDARWHNPLLGSLGDAFTEPLVDNSAAKDQVPSHAVAASSSDSSVTHEPPIVLGFFCPWKRCHCLRPFPSIEALITHIYQQKHISAEHMRSRQWICPACKRQVHSVQKLIFHVYSSFHLDYKPYQCPFSDCQRTFLSPGSYSHHLKTHHHNTASYTCACNLTFKQQGRWKNHFAHCVCFGDFLAEKHDFACPCGYRCNAREVATHDCALASTGIFVCPCKKTFAAKNRDIWQAHQRICKVARRPEKT